MPQTPGDPQEGQSSPAPLDAASTRQDARARAGDPRVHGARIPPPREARRSRPGSAPRRSERPPPSRIPLPEGRSAPRPLRSELLAAGEALLQLIELLAKRGVRECQHLD